LEIVVFATFSVLSVMGIIGAHLGVERKNHRGYRKNQALAFRAADRITMLAKKGEI